MKTRKIFFVMMLTLLSSLGLYAQPSVDYENLSAGTMHAWVDYFTAKADSSLSPAEKREWVKGKIKKITFYLQDHIILVQGQFAPSPPQNISIDENGKVVYGQAPAFKYNLPTLQELSLEEMWCWDRTDAKGDTIVFSFQDENQNKRFLCMISDPVVDGRYYLVGLYHFVTRFDQKMQHNSAGRVNFFRKLFTHDQKGKEQLMGRTHIRYAVEICLADSAGAFSPKNFVEESYLFGVAFDKFIHIGEFRGIRQKTIKNFVSRGASFTYFRREIPCGVDYRVKDKDSTPAKPVKPTKAKKVKVGKEGKSDGVTIPDEAKEKSSQTVVPRL